MRESEGERERARGGNECQTSVSRHEEEKRLANSCDLQEGMGTREGERARKRAREREERKGLQEEEENKIRR